MGPHSFNKALHKFSCQSCLLNKVYHIYCPFDKDGSILQGTLKILMSKLTPKDCIVFDGWRDGGRCEMMRAFMQVLTVTRVA